MQTDIDCLFILIQKETQGTHNKVYKSYRCACSHMCTYIHIYQPTYNISRIIISIYNMRLCHKLLLRNSSGLK